MHGESSDYTRDAHVKRCLELTQLQTRSWLAVVGTLVSPHA